jgi:hypothetical protein
MARVTWQASVGCLAPKIPGNKVIKKRKITRNKHSIWLFEGNGQGLLAQSSFSNYKNVMIF